MTRRFPAPWSVEELDASYVVRDHDGKRWPTSVFEAEPGRRSAAKLLTKDEARLMQYVTRAFGAYGVHRFDQANQIAQARRAARMCQHRAHRDHQPSRRFMLACHNHSYLQRLMWR